MNFNNIKKLVEYSSPKRCLDIGAHVGEFSADLKTIAPQCEIIAIEANPNCEPYLNKKGLRYEMIGLGVGQGTFNLFIEAENPIGTGASFYRENTQWYEGEKAKIVEVAVDSLDNRSYFKDEIIDLVKIDVQGAELDILNGGRETIMRSNYVIMEVSLLQYNIGAPLMDAIVAKMKEYSFHIEDILEYQRLQDGTVFQLDVLFKNKYIY
jgi:FkbM family methyltransferase